MKPKITLVIKKYEFNSIRDSRRGSVLLHAKTGKLHFGLTDENSGIVALTQCEDLLEWNGDLIPVTLYVLNKNEIVNIKSIFMFIDQFNKYIERYPKFVKLEFKIFRNLSENTTEKQIIHKLPQKTFEKLLDTVGYVLVKRQ